MLKQNTGDRTNFVKKIWETCHKRDCIGLGFRETYNFSNEQRKVHYAEGTVYIKTEGHEKVRYV